jgi:phasin family protein
MAEKSQAESFVEMFTKLGKDLKLPQVDVQGLVDHHRKNLEALEQSAKVYAQGTNTVLSKQREVVEAALRELTDMAKSFNMSGGPQDVMQKQAEFAKKSFEAALANTRDVAELMQKSGTDALAILQNRMRESMEEIRSAFDKKA